MIEKDDCLLFESDEDFEDFCVAPFAIVKQDENENYFIEGDYSDMYKKCIDEGKSFVIKDRNSQVYKRGCVTKRVPVQGTNRTTLVQLDVQNLEPYNGELYE